MARNIDSSYWFLARFYPAIFPLLGICSAPRLYTGGRYRLLHGLPVRRLLFSTGYCGGLAWLGYHCLWSVSLPHATAAIRQVRRTSRFADGTSLLRRFSPFPTLDAKLVPAVIFYNGLMDGSDPVHRLLLVDIHSTMQATALCILVSMPFGGIYPDTRPNGRRFLSCEHTILPSSCLSVDLDYPKSERGEHSSNRAVRSS